MLRRHRRRIRNGLPLTHPLPHPAEHLMVPLDRILRLEDPVVLVGEDQEARWDIPALERSEGGDSLGIGNSEVLLRGHDQLWGLPVLDEVDGIPALELLRRLKIGMTSMLPLVEP